MRNQTNQHTPLTVIVPCFNEEKNIEACLQSVIWADEILVVDSYSTDRTIEIAMKYTDRILQRTYENSADQKNWAIPQGKYRWILIVDSDERVTPDLKTEIQRLLNRGPKKDGYWIGRDNYLFGERIRYSGWGNDTVLRLFKRDMGRYSEKRVHAEIQLTSTGMLDARLEHHTVDSVNHWVNKINRYSSWKANDKMEAGILAPVTHMLVRPPFRFLKDFILRRGFLDGWRGFLIAAMSAFAELVMSAKLIQLLIGNKK